MRPFFRVYLAIVTVDPPNGQRPRQAMAQKEGVQIYSHDVIYRFLDDVKTVMSELLRVEVKETILGEAKTLQVSVLRVVIEV